MPHRLLESNARRRAVRGHQLTRTVAAACGLSATLGIAALTGWILGVPVLAEWLPGAAPMNPVTAFCLMMAAAAVWVHRTPRHSPSHGSRFATAAGFLVGAAALSCLLADSTPAGMAASAWLRSHGISWFIDGQRMAPNTAFALMAFGAGITMLDRKTGSIHPSGLVFLVTFAVALLALLGYIYGIAGMYRVDPFKAMSFPTTIGLMSLSLAGFCCRTDGVLTGFLVSQLPAASMIRRLLPVAIIAPIVLGWLRVRGQQLGLYSLEAGTAIMILSTIVVLVSMLIMCWRTAERESEESGRFLDSVVENLPTMVFIKDAADLRFVCLNRAAEELIGVPRVEMLGKNDFDFFPADKAAGFVDADREVLRSGQMKIIDTEELPTPDRGIRLLRTKKVPIYDAAGAPRYLLGISEDVTEARSHAAHLETLHRQLATRALQVEEANRELEAFSYSVSHDLRAPLRHIGGFADLVVRQNAAQLDATGARRLQTIAESARRMGQLIDDLLVFSRTSRAELKQEGIDPAAILADLVREAAEAEPTRKIDWRIGELPEITGDPAMIRQVFANLVDNALKYSGRQECTRVEVTARRDDGHTIFSIRDNGVGFDMTYADKLFGVFQRLHRQEDFPGTGIGLAHVRRIVQRHGGRIRAESAPGDGATFEFSLPEHPERRHSCAA